MRHSCRFRLQQKYILDFVETSSSSSRNLMTKIILSLDYVLHSRVHWPVENTCWFSEIRNYRRSRRITVRWRWRAISSAKGLRTRWYNERNKKILHCCCNIYSFTAGERKVRECCAWLNENPREIFRRNRMKESKRAYDEEPGSACDTRDKFNELPLGSSLKIRQKVLLLKEELRISNISKECENDSRPQVYFSQTALCKRILFNFFLVKSIWSMYF